MTVDSPGRVGATRLEWTFALVIGLSASGFAFHFPGSYGEPAIHLGAGIFGLIIGAVNGAIVGALVGLAIRAPSSSIGRLVAAMSACIGITHGIFDGSSTELPLIAYALLAGITVASVFALAFGDRTARSMVVITLSWGVGIWLASLLGDAIGLPLEETPYGWALDHAFDGLVTGLIWGAATSAIGLPDRLRKRAWD